MRIIFAFVALTSLFAPVAAAQVKPPATADLEEARKQHTQVEKRMDDEQYAEALPLAQRRPGHPRERLIP